MSECSWILKQDAQYGLDPDRDDGRFARRAHVVTYAARAQSKDDSEPMTVQAPPGITSAQPSPERRPPSRRTRANKRIAVLYNVDYEDARPEVDPGWAARAEVGFVAAGVAAALGEAGYDAQLVAVDGDLASLRSRLAEFETDCAFNLCESLGGDARLESAVPLLLELLGVPVHRLAPGGSSALLSAKIG